jgi:hypothetical protein
MCDEDRNEYEQLESAALSFYKAFKDQHAHEVQRHYLAKLKPLRAACAGGQAPLEISPDQNDDEDIPTGKVGKTHVLSEHAFTSKSKRLIEELKRIQTKDPSGMFSCLSGG